MYCLLNQILRHEYSLTLYGVLLWQVEQYIWLRQPFREFLPQSVRNIGSSLIWVGIIVVFDDELLAQYNHIAKVDYMSPPWWMYMISGFLIDIGRSKFTKLKSEKST